ncbi:MAG TPA: AbrB/MazE/SpoVT family DNA-binding domain-containing protein [Candidatus Omnitrophota bacterium]|nr:AbrB/MazE/SpoVT family DNA-binding domain-containing protein [Candidatus Omnitrophota bacterium]HPT39091.1 AbrB/MazE/SpoVT family DNA-binding domain-containing protein [Candidatus Omnitrophota bacterium]
MSNPTKFYGKVPVGSKGQIVIPAEARRAMDIKPGDNVVIISGPAHLNKVMSIVPEGEFNKFLKFFEDHLADMKKIITEK